MARFKLWAAAAAAFGLAFASPEPVGAQTAEGVAAVVNDQVISTWDVRQRTMLLMISSGIEPSREAFERFRIPAMRSLVDEALQLQEAKEYKLEITDREVENAFANIARSNNSSTEQLRQELARAGVNPATLMGQLKADIAWRRLVNGRFGSRIRISDVQIRETLSRIAQNASKPQYQVMEVLIPAESEQEFQQAEQSAARLVEELQRGARFDLVARQFSAAASAANGGNLGWVSLSELRPELQPVVAAMQPGTLAAPFRGTSGVNIVLLQDRQEAAAAADAALVLRKIAAPATQRASLSRAASRITSCESLPRAVSSVSGADVVDLGSFAESELSDTVRAQLQGVEPGRAGEVVVDGDGVSALVLCSRTATFNGQIPTRDEVEDRLYSQELAMLAQRYLRNLRREATIITRQQ